MDRPPEPPPNPLWHTVPFVLGLLGWAIPSFCTEPNPWQPINFLTAAIGFLVGAGVAWVLPLLERIGVSVQSSSPSAAPGPVYYVQQPPVDYDHIRNQQEMATLMWLQGEQVPPTYWYGSR